MGEEEGSRVVPAIPAGTMVIVQPPPGPFGALLRAWLSAEAPVDREAALRGAHPGATAADRLRRVDGTELPSSRPKVAPPLLVPTGDPGTDQLLAGLAPALVALLENLTDRQRQVARLLLVDGLRPAEVASQLGISRPTVSVMVERAHLRAIGRLVAALDAIVAGAGR